MIHLTLDHSIASNGSKTESVSDQHGTLWHLEDRHRLPSPQGEIEVIPPSRWWGGLIALNLHPRADPVYLLHILTSVTNRFVLFLLYRQSTANDRVDLGKKMAIRIDTTS